MKHFFIIVAVIAASLCSCSNGRKLVILAAEETEYNRCMEVFPEIECIRTGVGAGNVIRACTDGNYKFDDHANPLHLIASFSPLLELLAAVKIVSDNLSVDAFLNNAIRESGVLTSDEV